MNKTILFSLLLSLLVGCSTSNPKNDRSLASAKKKWKWNEKGSSKKIKFPVRPFLIEFVDADGKIIDKYSEGVNFWASLLITQPEALVNFDFFLAGNLPLPRKNYKNDLVFIETMSSRTGQGRMVMDTNSLKTREDKDYFEMKFEMYRKSYCEKKSSSSVVKFLKIGKQISMEYNLNTKINNEVTTCKDLFSFKGSREALEEKLNSFPSVITCQLDQSIADFNSKFLTHLKENTDELEECKDAL